MIDLREIQRPLKQRYREEPGQAVILSAARCTMERAGDPRVCRVEAGPMRLRVGAHEGVGGSGADPCSGDVLVAALAACQQITLQMVAAAMGIALESCEVTVKGELDLRGTLGVDRDVPVGYRDFHCEIRASAPQATPEQRARLIELGRRFCVVHDTLAHGARVEVTVSG
jgi:uncharacterized OsmC-like protein